MANMFKTIQKQGGSGGPQWLSDITRTRATAIEYITREAQAACASRIPFANTRGFQQVQAHLKQLPPAADDRAGDGATPKGGRPDRNVGQRDAPARAAAWKRRPRASAPTPKANRFSRQPCRRTGARLASGTNQRDVSRPDGAHGQSNGQSVFTHGVELGIGRNETHDLQRATEELIDSLASGNPNLSRPAALSNASPWAANRGPAQRC